MMKGVVNVDWFISLTKDEQAFIYQLIIASGSLKRLSQIYEVSYPTVRLRLDRIIDKIELLKKDQKSTFEVKIMQLVIDEKIELDLAKEIIYEYREEKNA